MTKNIQILRRNFEKYNIDGYIIPRNDDYFTEYCQKNRLKIISNFTGSAGIAVILKKKNYLFTDGRYAIQSQIESGKSFKIINYEKIINCNLFKNLTLGIDPKLFTYTQIKRFFLKYNKIKFVKKNLIDEIENQNSSNDKKFFPLHKNVTGESTDSKLTKISSYLKKNKSDYIFITAPENVAWILNIRGFDVPNSPLPNCRLIISKTKKFFLISKIKKCKKLFNKKIINKKSFFDIDEFQKKIENLKGKNFIIDKKSCSIFFEEIIKSKFRIIKKNDPTYLLKSIKNQIQFKP